MFSSVARSFAMGGAVAAFLPAFVLVSGFSAGNCVAQSNPKFRVLAFFSASYDAAHINYAHETNATWPKFAQQYGFAYDSTKNWDMLSDQTALSKYKVIMFLDDQPPSNDHAGFQTYMENGGGFIGYHVSAFCTNANEWPWYHTTFLGCGAFNSNTWGPTSAKMRVEDTTHPVTKGFPTVYTSEVSEWYNWTVDIRKNPDIKILCSIDPSSYPLGTDPNQSWYSGYNPIVWTNTKYKMIYNNSGHNDMNYSTNVGLSKTWGNDQHVKLIMNALFWLAGASATGINGVTSSGEPSGNPDFDIHFDQARLTVAKTGVPFFDVSVLDARGRMLRSGRSENGVFSTDRVDLGKGLYIVRAQSPEGNMARTLSLP